MLCSEAVTEGIDDFDFDFEILNPTPHLLKSSPLPPFLPSPFSCQQSIGKMFSSTRSAAALALRGVFYNWHLPQQLLTST
jgi:hypothetical protein